MTKLITEVTIKKAIKSPSFSVNTLSRWQLTRNQKITHYRRCYFHEPSNSHYVCGINTWRSVWRITKTSLRPKVKKNYTNKPGLSRKYNWCWCILCSQLVLGVFLGEADVNIGVLELRFAGIDCLSLLALFLIWVRPTCHQVAREGHFNETTTRNGMPVSRRTYSHCCCAPTFHKPHKSN